MPVPFQFHQHQRQVHLDFHTSPWITDVAATFDSDAFAKTMAEAHVNSVTIFAKCHHGMSYYPTKVGTPHPALNGRDLLGEMIEALHRRHIRCPIYTTVAWEEDVAARFPEWRQMRKDGTFAEAKTQEPGKWKFNNFLHRGYQDYIEAHLTEVLDNYAVDGIFFDILFFDPEACWGKTSLRFREKHGLLGTDQGTQIKFETAAQQDFTRRFTRMIRGKNRQATIFYNSINNILLDSTHSCRTRHASQTHWEIESLPSGFWGYYHFSRLARAISHWGKPWLGMTGRFQKMWGDFGGLKPVAALEYECFRTQALGGANSVGDQLPPRGTLDAGAYQLIGKVFGDCKRAEPFYQGSKALPQIGILSPSNTDTDLTSSDKSIEGAVQMCEEMHYDCAVLDDRAAFDGYSLLILPDSALVSEKVQIKLQKFYRSGGKLLISHQSGFDRKDRFILKGVDLKKMGEVDLYPTYWRVKPSFSASLSLSDRVFYQPGLNVEAGRNLATVVARVLPYFKRTDLTYSSHFQTPPIAQADPYPAVLSARHLYYFADPIFREYRQSGNIAARDICNLAIEKLIGKPPFGFGLPKTVLVVPRRKKNDLLLTLLHYIPIRKALDIDMIEEGSSFSNEHLRLPKQARQVIDEETGDQLTCVDKGTFLLPNKKGRLLLRSPNFFNAPAHGR